MRLYKNDGSVGEAGLANSTLAFLTSWMTDARSLVRSWRLSGYQPCQPWRILGCRRWQPSGCRP